MIYRILADAVLISHSVFVAFVIGGLIAIVLGAFFHWQWARNFLFRIAHLVAIAIVILQTWLGIICPLTEWEMRLRLKGGEPVYQESFIAHWLHQLIFYESPDWVFNLCYTVFGCAVIAAWFLVPPRLLGDKASSST